MVTSAVFLLVAINACIVTSPGMAEDGFSPVRHIRSPLLRAVYNRLQEDQQHQNDPHDYVRQCPLSINRPNGNTVEIMSTVI